VRGTADAVREKCEAGAAADWWRWLRRSARHLLDQLLLPRQTPRQGLDQFELPPVIDAQHGISRPQEHSIGAAWKRFKKCINLPLFRGIVPQRTVPGHRERLHVCGGEGGRVKDLAVGSELREALGPPRNERVPPGGGVGTAAGPGKRGRGGLALRA